MEGDTVVPSPKEQAIVNQALAQPQVSAAQATSILEMIKAKGMRPSDLASDNVTLTYPQSVVKAPEDPRTVTQPKEEQKVEIPKPLPEAKPEPRETKPEEAKITGTPLPGTTDAPGQEDPEDIELNKLENFKVLRAKIKESKLAIKEKEEALTSTKAKLEKYEKGEVLPESLKAREARIAELERFEHVHALKTSPAYKKSFVEPVQAIQTKLQTIAKDYGMNTDEIGHALSITNKRELNQYLSNHFDPAGILEVKTLVDEAQTITEKARLAEAEPAKVLAQIEEEHRVRIEQETARAHAQMSESAVDSWARSLTDIRKEGKLQELIPKVTDPEYNRKYVEPVINAAAKEHGELITKLANSGLKELPNDLAYGLARMIQLAHASAVNVQARIQAEKELQELSENTQRETRYSRPFSSGYAPSSGSDPLDQKVLMDPLAAARKSREGIV